MTPGPSQELDVGLHIGHTFQDVSILYPLYAPYRFLQELEHIMFCAVLAIRSVPTYWPYIPECFNPLITICAIQIPVGIRTYYVLCCTGDQVRFNILNIYSRIFYPLITICAIQIPVGVRTYHVLCCTGDQVRFDILAIHSRMFFILYPLYASYRLLQELEHIMF